MINKNNETLGISAEKVLCALSGLDYSTISHRSLLSFETRISSILEKALKELPQLTKYVGTKKGERGYQSKSPIDFITIDNKTLSVKTTMNSSFKLCPSECGQPGSETFDLYFGHLYDGPINYNKFKQLVLTKVDKMIPIYLDHLFDCDYMLLVCIDSPSDGYYIFKKKDLPSFTWDRKRFSFTKTSMSEWNESNTVKYDGISIGEFQAHNHRHSYKFRFHIMRLAEVMSAFLPSG